MRRGQLTDRSGRLGRVSTSLRSPRVRSLLLAGAATSMVLLFWWMEDFYLHFRGDATVFPGRCDALVSAPLDWLGSFQALRTVFQVPYCAVYEVGGVRGWVVAQILLWALTCVLVYRTGAVLFDDDTGLLAGLALVPLWETFRFAIRPQDDLMLLFMLSVVLYALARDWRTETSRWRALSVVAIGLFAFTRPSAIPIALGLIGWKIAIKLRQGDRTLRTPAVLGMVGIAILILGYVAFTFLTKHLSLEHATQATHWREGLTAAWANGIVVTHPDVPTFQYTYRPRAASTMAGWLFVNLDHLAIMGLFKAAFFFVPILPRWSTLHIVINAMTVFPLTVGAVAGTATLLARGQVERAALLLVPVVMTVLLVAGFYLDGGFNYRAPATLGLAMLSAVWIRDVVDRVSIRGRVVSPTGSS